LKNAKRIIAMCLCAIMVLNLTGCGGQQTDAESDSYIPIDITEEDFSSVEEWSGQYSTAVVFSGSQAQITGGGASIENGVLTVTEEGDYMLSGSFQGQVVVDADECNVRLILSGVEITCSDSSAIYVANAKNVYITLADGTGNSVTDGAQYIFEDGADEPDAAIFSHDDLIFDGTGTLVVNANYNNGIRSKDDLEFIGGNYTVTAVDNGISGKDSVAIKDGSFTINAGGDGIRSTNDTDDSKGWISIAGGSFDITAGQDGIQSCTTLSITGGDFGIFTGGGSASGPHSEDWGNWGGFGGMGEEPPGGFGGGMGARSSDETTRNSDGWGYYDSSSADGSESAKAIKSGNDMRISAGTFTVDSADDSIHCGGSLEINGGTYSLSSGDDGIHSDNALVINDGMLTVQKSYEGIEAITIDIYGGTTNITASDDGINSAGGNDASAFGGFGGMGGGFGEGSDDYYVSIADGFVSINASGDGIDSNGDLFIKGGSTYISGPTNSGNSPVDYALSFTVTGGTFVAFGSAGMATNASSSSTQPVVMVALNRTASAGTTFTITSADGSVVYSGQPEKDYGCIIFSAPSMKIGEKVTVTIDSEKAELSVESMVTTYGSQGGPGGGMGGPGGRTA